MQAAIYTLGCKVNQYETQAMEQELVRRGHTLVPFDQKADVYIVNTCSVTAVSDKKSRQMIRRCRKLNPNAVVAACGCYVQTHAEEAAGLDVYGGVNAPYIWLKTPGGMDSWRFFEALLNRFGIVGTPGVGFGPSGEGYFRLTAFGSHENTRKAMRRIADAGHWSEWKI